MIRSKKIVFWFITCSFPLILIGILECILYLAQPNLKNKGSDPFLDIDSPISIFSEVEINGEKFYRVTHPEAYRARNIIFPVKKGSNVIRVFCLGDSASAGWPHPPSEIYSEYLRQALQKVFPQRTIEVLNVSAHAFASYRVRLIFDDVINYEPDLLIIYSGNNEFLEERVYPVNNSFQEKLNAVRSKLRFLRSFRYLEDMVIKAKTSQYTLSGKGVMRENFNLLYSKVKKLALDLRKDPYQFKQVQKHYKFNIEYMIRKADEKKVPIILLAVPVNLKDWHPNVSYNQLSDAALSNWKNIYQFGEKNFIEKDYNKAIEYFKKAVELEPLHAESYFYLGRAFESKGSYELALKNYKMARDLDYNPFRALSSFNASIREISLKHDNVFLVDLEKLFIDKSEGRIPGFDLFLDYVHPTKKGNLVIANAIFDRILGSNILRVAPTTLEFSYNPSPFFPNGDPYDENKDIELQGALLYLFGAMHQYDGLIEKAKLIKKILAQIDMTDKALDQYILIEGPGRMLLKRVKDRYERHGREADYVLEIFPKYQEIQKKEIMGLPANPQEKEIVSQQYRNYYSSKSMLKGISPIKK